MGSPKMETQTPQVPNKNEKVGLGFDQARRRAVHDETGTGGIGVTVFMRFKMQDPYGGLL